MVAQSRKRSNGCASRVEDGYTKAVLDMRRGDAPRWGTAWVRLVRSAICGGGPAAPARRGGARRSPAPAIRSPGPSCVLRQRLRVNNARLGVALQTLQQRGLAVRSPAGWHLAILTRTVGCLPPLIRPPFRTRDALGTNDHRPHSAPSVVQLTSARGAQRNTVFVVFVGLLTVQRKEDSLGRS